jgi:hypothetical protein
MTSKTDNTDLSALTGALDDTAARIRELNESVGAGQGARDVRHRNDGGVHRGGQGRTQIRTDH